MAKGLTLSMIFVTIGRKIFTEVLRHVEASPDMEVCGLLFGTIATITDARSARNVAADPARTFEIDPAALIDAHRAARNGALPPVGCYHSHPGGDATPSATDQAAAEPGALWLILAAGSARLWIAEAGGFREISLAIA